MSSYLETVFADMPDAFSSRQLAEKLGKDPRTIRMMIMRKELTGYPIGETLVLFKAQVIEELEASRQKMLDEVAAGEARGDRDDLGLPED